MGKLESYKSKAPEFQKLPAGDHTVRLVSYKATDSFHNYDGTIKENLPEYKNATEQLVITVVSTEGKGGITHRLNLDGYLRYSQLTKKEVESGKFIEIDDFACAKDPKTGIVVRLSDEARSKTCEGILDQFMGALQMPVGSAIEDLDIAIANKVEFVVKVTKDEYKDKDQYRIGGFRKKAVSVPAGGDLES